MDVESVASPFEAYLPVLLRRWAVEDPDLPWRTLPGTLVMLDISGFTRLTERLAARGRAGAEELSDILHDVFGALLDEAMDEGCDLLKWGGDAVLLACTGPEAARRGARAAVRMRTALDRVGHLRTTAGRVVLRASTGVASGDLHLVLAGDPSVHRELLVLGPTVSSVVRLEAMATAGQVLLDAATADALEPALVGRATGAGPGAALALRGLPGASGRRETGSRSFPRRRLVTPRARPGAVDLSQLVPTQLRLHLSRGAHEPEHRVAATAFIRFDGTDSLLAKRGPAGVATAVDELVRNVQDATQRHGVSFHETDVDVDGGKIMLVAGAPLSSGDDVDHMLAAVRLVMDRRGTSPCGPVSPRGGSSPVRWGRPAVGRTPSRVVR